MAAIKHADGKSWWLLTKHTKETSGACNKIYQTYLLTSDTIMHSVSQSFGFASCHDGDIYGELVSSSTGTLIANAYYLEDKIDLLRFDRCTGQLSHALTLSFNGNNDGPYSIEFSQNNRILYLSTGFGRNGGLYQFVFDSSFSNYTTNTIWLNTSTSMQLGQLELAPNNKIYLTTYVSGNVAPTENKYLSVINHPDSVGLACDFQPFSFYVGDSSFTRLSLPNMPNYNLGATSIYQAGAGVDTFYCTTDTTKGVTIGANPINGVTYQWQNNDIAEPDKLIQIVKPPTSTWYYLQITDTTIVSSCTSRIDSVFVEVRVCTGVEEIEASNIRVFPNPTSSSVSVISSGVETSAYASAGQRPFLDSARNDCRFSIYNLLGEQVYSQQITQAQTQLNLDLPDGIYIYKILAAGKVLSSNKLVIVQ